MVSYMNKLFILFFFSWMFSIKNVYMCEFLVNVMII